MSDLAWDESKPNTVYLINTKSQKLTSLLLRLWSKCESAGCVFWSTTSKRPFLPPQTHRGSPEIWHRWRFAVSRFKWQAVCLEMRSCLPISSSPLPSCLSPSPTPHRGIHWHFEMYWLQEQTRFGQGKGEKLIDFIICGRKKEEQTTVLLFGGQNQNYRLNGAELST